MEFQDFTEYFENIAKANKAVAHDDTDPKKNRFFEGDPDEFITATNTELPDETPVMLLEPFILGTIPENADYFPDVWNGGFMILMHFDRNERDYAKQSALYNATIKIAKSIRNRMLRDRLLHNLITNDVIRYFDPASATITKVDMAKGNGWIGARCEFIIHTPGDDYNPDEWNDENT